MGTSCAHRLPLACLTVKYPLKFTVISRRFNAHTGDSDGRLNPKRALGQPKRGFFGLYKIDTCLLHAVNLTAPGCSFVLTEARAASLTCEMNISGFSSRPVLIGSPIATIPHATIRPSPPLPKSQGDYFKLRSSRVLAVRHGGKMELPGPQRTWTVSWGLRLTSTFNGFNYILL